MALESAQQIQKFITDAGKAGANALFPNDFEYYAITLELTDSKGTTVDYLTFPVNPEGIDYNETSLVNIKKTLGGVTALDTSSFIPKKYTITGTFGKKFRLLLTKPSTSELSTDKGVYDKIQSGLEIKTSVLNAKLKTGYGTTKLLEAIITKSSGLDQYNRPMRLYLYNPTLNHNFLVKSQSIMLHQDKQASNMMWKYTLTLTAIAPIDRLKVDQDVDSSLLNSSSISVLSKGANILAKNIKQSIF
jgi:hypothetical protein